MTRSILWFLAIMGLTSCSTGPLIMEASKNGRPLVYDCKNVNPNQEINNFDREFYHTTNGSAWSEARRYKTIDENPIGVGTTILTHMPSEGTYGMFFPEPKELVTSTVYDTVRQLGFNFQLSSPSSGEFVTETVANSHGSLADQLMNREHSEAEATVKWRETYYLHVSENIEGGTDLRVFRDVWIARKDEGDWTRFIRAMSDGQNEAWIVLRVNKRLGNKDFGRSPPNIGGQEGIRQSMSREDI